LPLDYEPLPPPKRKWWHLTWLEVVFVIVVFVLTATWLLWNLLTRPGRQSL
jgi:hypothetical protein